MSHSPLMQAYVRIRRYNKNLVKSSGVAYGAKYCNGLIRSHNPKVVGSNPASAICTPT